MKIKIFLFALLLVFVFGVAGNVFAMTEQERQALIAQIQQQLGQLQIQLAQMIAQEQAQGNQSWCYTFNTNLGFANSGSNEVYNLHMALQKEGISYGADDINTYSIGTSQAVIAFQAKYKITQTGYVGALTRSKLNSLYACGTGTTTICTPSWTCGDWGFCIGGQQTKTCTDSNNCGVDTKKPKTSQTCTQQSAVKIKADGSDGPLNVFLTLGNGASVDGSGIILTKNINLQWDGIDVSSCQASDTANPNIFSGYRPTSGSLTVTLSGKITSSTNKITDTLKITCVSVKTGNSVTDSVVVNLFYTVNNNCSASWSCTAWTDCLNKKHTRTCTDWNGCGSLVGKPIETESCGLAPTVNIKANSSDGPVAISNGSSASLSWTSANTTSCIASGDYWSGARAVNGTEVTTAITSSRIYTIDCTGSGGSVSDSVTVNVSGN